jgi:DtxR family Mn-dependent transcriptional regulator
MISSSLEEYLRNMYILDKKQGSIRVTDIANSMNCSKPSVNKAIKSLSEKNLVTYETYGEIQLTSEGEQYAKKIIESYDIVYVFLKDVLGLEEELAESEAEKLKSDMSDVTINKLVKYVHKELGLTDLSCDYDVNQQRCRECLRVSIRERKGDK